ncbi:MAG: glycosyltransferase family 4 protein [Phycisphaerae bacterium]
MGNSGQLRVIWVQNKPNHYFVEMLDKLNARNGIEYFGIFLFPPPAGNVSYRTPKISPHVFLGDPAEHGGPNGYKRLGTAAQEYIKKLEFSAAIVGGYDSRFKRWVLRYCKGRGVPTALFVDSNIRAERGRSAMKKLKRFAKRIFLRRIINQVDRVIPCNRCGVAYWRYYGCPANKVARSTYYCAVDIPAALAVNRTELFARYQLDPNCKLIFTAARLVPAKALHLLVEAFTKSGLAAKGWVWAVAGDGPLRQNLENMAAERSRCAGTIRFLGAVAPADIPALMAQSEVFVLPSVYEPHGIVVAEAMAVGTPVIASNDCGAARDLVRNGKTGWLFKSGEAAGLLRVLRAATGDSAQPREMRILCRRAFAKWYGRYDPLAIIPEFFRTAARRR